MRSAHFAASATVMTLCPSASAFFAVEPESVISDAFALKDRPTLYGRHNVIYNQAGKPLAEVVEILPPLAMPAPPKRAHWTKAATSK